MKKSTREVRLSVNNSTIQFKTVYTICGYLITFEQREKCEQQRHLRLLFTRLSCRKNMAGASSLTFNQANRQLTFLDVFHTLPLSIFFFSSSFEAAASKIYSILPFQWPLIFNARNRWNSCQTESSESHFPRELSRAQHFNPIGITGASVRLSDILKEAIKDIK